MVTRPVELDLLAPDQQKGRVRHRVANGLAQGVERLPEIAAGKGFRTIGPKQADQSIPTMGSVGFHREKSQQGAGFLRFSWGRAAVADTNLQWSQHVQFQVCQKSLLARYALSQNQISKRPFPFYSPGVELASEITMHSRSIHDSLTVGW